MATIRQIEANRRNALRSTGPRTSAGKARAARNATTHGLTAAAVVLASEDDVAFEQLRADLHASYQPVGAQEHMLVDQIAAGHWRVIRSRRYEKALLESDVQSLKRTHNVDPSPDHDDQAAAVSLAVNDHYRNYFRYDAAISRDFYRAVNTLERLQARRWRNERDLERRLLAPPLPRHRGPRSAAVTTTAEAPIGFVSFPDTQPAAQTTVSSEPASPRPGLRNEPEPQLDPVAPSPHPCNHLPPVQQRPAPAQRTREIPADANHPGPRTPLSPPDLHQSGHTR